MAKGTDSVRKGTSLQGEGSRGCWELPVGGEGVRSHFFRSEDALRSALGPLCLVLWESSQRVIPPEGSGAGTELRRRCDPWPAEA